MPLPGSRCPSGGSRCPLQGSVPAPVPAPGAGGAGRCRGRPRARGDISPEKGAGGGDVRHCRPGDSGTGAAAPQDGEPGPLVRAEPGGAAEDRAAVRPRAGAAAGALDPGPVRRRRRPCPGTAPARQGRLPALAQGRHRAVPAHQQPPPPGPSPRSQDPGLGHGLPADGADLPVPAGGGTLRDRPHGHLPDRGSVGREEPGVCAAHPDEPGQSGGRQGRRALPRRPQLVPQEIPGEPAGVLGGQAEGGAERHRAADGHQPGGVPGGHDGLRDAPADPLSPFPPKKPASKPLPRPPKKKPASKPLPRPPPPKKTRLQTPPPPFFPNPHPRTKRVFPPADQKGFPPAKALPGPKFCIIIIIIFSGGGRVAVPTPLTQLEVP